MFIGPEESVVLDAFLPKVLALVPLLKVELHYVLVVALWRYMSYIIKLVEREKMKIRTKTRFHTILCSFCVQYDSVCVVQSFLMVDDEIECTF